MWALLPYLKVKLPSLAESIKTVPWNGKGTQAELVLSIVEIAPYCFRLCEWQVWSCDLGTNIPLCVLFDPCSRVPGQYPLPCSHNTWRMYAGHVRHQLWDQDDFDLAVQHSSCKKLKLLGLLEEVFEKKLVQREMPVLTEDWSMVQCQCMVFVEGFFCQMNCSHGQL